MQNAKVIEDRLLFLEWARFGILDVECESYGTRKFD